MAAVALGMASALALAGCSSGSSGGEATPGGTSSGAAAGPLTLWAHKGNAPAETQALEAAVKGFNAANPTTPVTIKFIPENDYPNTVQAASASALPDILEVDGPTMAAQVRSKRLVDLNGLLAPKTVENLTGPIKDQGTLDGKLYTVGQFNSAIGVYGNKKLLDAAGVKYPTSLADDWTAEEFTAAVKTLAAKNPKLPGKSLDLKLNYGKGGLTGEFGTFAYSPLVWSAGGDLLKDGKATGALNSEATAKVFSTVASWRSYVTPNTDDKDFASGKVALSYVGHWAYPDYSKALGADLLALPLPNFGKGPKTGAGSWSWGVTPNSKNAKAAASFVDYLLNDENVATMVATNGAPPGTKSAMATSKLYGKGGPLALWGEMASAASASECAAGTSFPDTCMAIVRPRTAGYPVVTLQFANALDAVFKGAEAKATLDKAAATIDTDFADNDGYK
jgi:ABC-type glycerol-3-phosphate transport system substrate-binding protein